ncbi:MAG: MerR family transcriptional regulator [Chloroflexota bacterium]
MTRVDHERTTDWISLGEASTLLGIARGTLRRWADGGRVPVFTTPGGHRRFSRTAIVALLPASRPHRPTLLRLGVSPERIARAYHSRRIGSRAPATPWAVAMSEADRIAFRERGRRLVTLLLDHLDADDAALAADRLREAERLAADYGREVAALGSSMTEAVQGFLRFRSPFVDELATIARKRGLDTREATALLTDAENAMDRLLVAMMTGHSLGAGPRRLRARHDRPARPPESSR